MVISPEPRYRLPSAHLIYLDARTDVRQGRPQGWNRSAQPNFSLRRLRRAERSRERRPIGPIWKRKTPDMANKAIVAIKVGMTQLWDEDNRVVPVTMLQVEPCRVVQVKTDERDGYTAVQVTFGQRDATKLSKPEAGHFDAAGVEPGQRLVELRLDDVSEIEVGQEFAADVLEAGEKVDVTAVSKGKGFAGVMKRHNFAGLKASHGVRGHRAPGSIGACATPSRVFKGKKMPGRMGAEKVTTLNLTVVQADAEREILLIRGSVPGPKGGVVVVRDAVKG